MLIRKQDEVVSGNPKGFDEIEKKKRTRDDLPVL